MVPQTAVDEQRGMSGTRSAWIASSAPRALQIQALEPLELAAQIGGHGNALLVRVVVAHLDGGGLDHQSPRLALADLIPEGERLPADPLAADRRPQHFRHERLGAEVDGDVGEDERHLPVIGDVLQAPPILLARHLEIGDVDRVVEMAHRVRVTEAGMDLVHHREAVSRRGCGSAAVPGGRGHAATPPRAARRRRTHATAPITTRTIKGPVKIMKSVSRLTSRSDRNRLASSRILARCPSTSAYPYHQA